MNQKLVLVLLLGCALQVATTYAACSLTFTVNKPIIYRSFGSHNVEVKNIQSSMSYQTDEIITLHCYSGFSEPQVAATTLKASCTRGYVQFDVATNQYYQQTSQRSVRCKAQKWNLYETRQPFKWCRGKDVSYALGRTTGLPQSSMEYSAGVCYNLNKMHLKSVYYALSPPSSEYLFPASLNDTQTGIEITHYDDIFQNSIQSFFEDPEIAQWMLFANYEDRTILETGHLHDDKFKDFSNMLNIKWWSSLRQGNWPQYEKALAQHIRTNAATYDVLAGISGAMTVPVRQSNCASNLSLIEPVNLEHEYFPLYIWNYLSSTRNHSEDVVVIAINSPFYNFHDKDDIIFCKDICSQFSWLQNIYPQFKYSALGIIFCCSVDEVEQSKRLDGFVKMSNPIIPMPTPSPLSSL